MSEKEYVYDVYDERLSDAEYEALQNDPELAEAFRILQDEISIRANRLHRGTKE